MFDNFIIGVHFGLLHGCIRLGLSPFLAKDRTHDTAGVVFYFGFFYINPYFSWAKRSVAESIRDMEEGKG